MSSPPAAASEGTAQPASTPRVVLVTGAAKRLGRTIALGLAQAGWDVAIHFNSSAEAAQAVQREVNACGRRAATFAADLDDATQAAALISRVSAELGRIDAVVNSAARFEFDAPASFDPAVLSRHLGPNLVAPLTLARELYAACLASGHHGAIVNVLDQKVAHLNPDFFSYTLTKAALQAATQMMAMAMAPQLRVNAVSPGATLPSWKQSAEQFDQARKIALLEQSSRPEDIAQAVTYLLDAPAVTGVNLIVDGGQHLMSLDRDVMFLSSKPAQP